MHGEDVSASTPHAMGTSKEGDNPLATVRYVALATRYQRLICKLLSMRCVAIGIAATLARATCDILQEGYTVGEPLHILICNLLQVILTRKYE